MIGERNHRKHSPDKDALCVFCWIEDRALLQRENERLTAELARFKVCEVGEGAATDGRFGCRHSEYHGEDHRAAIYHREGVRE